MLKRISRAILAALADSCWFGNRALRFLLDSAAIVDSYLVFAIELNCWYPNDEEWNCPKKLLLNRSTTPFSY